MARHWLQRISSLWATSRTSSFGRAKRHCRGLRWRRLAGEPLEQRRLLTVFSVPVDSPTIQGAINLAALDDPGAGHHTIHVANGLYAENLTIAANPFLAGLELIGDGVDPANPNDPTKSTIVQPAGGITLDILQDGTAAAPVTISGFNLKSAGVAAGDWPVEILSGVDFVTLDGNWIDTRGPASQGVSLTGPNDHLTFSSNRFLFDENGGDVALNFNPESTDAAATNVLVDDNTFVPDAGTNVHRAMKFGNVTNLSITGNTLGSRIGFHVGGGGVASQAVAIAGNHFLAESRSGVFFIREGAGTFGGGPLLSDRLSIHDNDYSARDPGVYFYADAADPVASLLAANFPAPVFIQHNNFHGYAAGQEAIRVGEVGSSLAITIDAADNWWGSADGPTAVGNTFNVATQGATIANNGGAAIQFVTWWNSIAGSAGGYTGTPFAPVHVGAKPFSSIQAAIDDAATVDGNTVDIATGVYSETVHLTKSLALVTSLHTATAEQWTSAPGTTTHLSGGYAAPATAAGSGIFQFDGAIVLDADVILTSTNGGNISFNSTVDSQTATARNLDLNTAGVTKFAGQVGGANPLGNVTTDAAGQTRFEVAASPDVVTTGGQTYNDAVRLALDTLLSSTAGGDIVFNSTVDSQIATTQSLAVNTVGTTQFAGQVGAADALASLATNAGGQTILGVIAGLDVVTTGGQTYNDAVQLAQDATLVSTAAGDIVFTTTVDSQAAARALAVNTGGTTRLNGAVGGLNPLASLQTDAPGTTDINGGSVITVGGQAYNDSVLLSADAVLTSLGAGNVVFGSTLNSETATARALLVNTGGATQFAGQVGGIFALASLATDIGGQTIVGVAASPDVITTGEQTYNDAVQLALDATLRSTGAGNIAFGDTVDSQTATERVLAVNTSGDTRFDGQVGGLHPLASISTDAGGQTIFAVAASPSATTTGDQTYGDALRLDLNTSLYSNNNGNFLFAAVNSAAGALSSLAVTVDPAPAVSTSVGGEITFAGVVGADAARRLGALTALGNGPLAVAAAVHTQGNVLLTVRDAEFPDGASNNAIDHRNRIALGAAGGIASDAGNITLQAGDSVVLPAGSNLSVVAPSVVTIEIGFADVGGRGLGEIAGAISTLNAGTLAQTAVVVNGGAGHDRLVLRSAANLPKPGLVFDADGNATGAAGDADKDLLIVEGSADGDNFYVTDGNFDGSIQWARGYVAPANPPYFTAPLVVPPNPEAPQPKIQYKNIETLELDTLSGNDRVTFLMSANPNLRFRADGGQPTPAPILANFDAQYVDGVRFIGTSGNDTIAVGDFGSANRFQVKRVGILQAFGENGIDTISNNTVAASIRLVQGGVPGTFAWTAAPVASLLVGGNGNDTITGGDNDDVLFGGAGVDTLSALRGSDYLFSDHDLSKDTYLPTAVVPADNGDSLDGGLGLLAPTSVTITGALQEEHDSAAYEGTDLLTNIDIAAGHGGILDPWMWLTMRFSDTATLLDRGLSQPFARPFPPAPSAVPMPLIVPKTLTIKGASGNDTLEFVAGADAAHWILKLNGKAVAVDPATVAVVFAGGAGTDTVKFTGAGGADQAELWPSAAVFRGEGYKLSVSQVESIVVNGAGGDDAAVLHDSKWADTLTASAQQARFVGKNGRNTVFSHTIVGVESVTVYADTGGKDAAVLNGASGNDQFTGSRSSAQMKIGAATIVANGFESVTAVAGRAGTGAAYLYDSASNDTFTGRPGLAVLAGAGYSLTAKGFGQAIAAASGGYDIAELFGSTGNDALAADRDSAKLSAGAYSSLAKGFDEVHANGLGGTDTAQIVDGRLSAGKIARGSKALPLSLHQLAWLFAFEQIQQTDTTGGTAGTQKAAKDQVFTAYWA